MRKAILLSLAFICISYFASAQLKAKPSCGEFSVDILNGTVDNAKPDFVLEQIKQKFPCFTSEEKETDKCGSALFYQDKDIKFYIKRQYVEIGPAFKGKMSIPLMGAARGSLFKYFGNVKIKDASWDAYQTQYGTLVLHYNAANKVNLIQFSTKSTEELNLCE
ncbi:MAG TPA: hypothetical protein VKT28_16420 [Puia sp.]|nr:hypothetical protein [Puia sp.]